MQPHEYEKMYEAEDRYFWFVGKNRLVRALIEQSLVGIEQPLLLDVGCGTGGLLGGIPSIYSAVGADADSRALEYCRKRGLDMLTLADWENPPFRENCFDLVVADDFIEHLDDDAAALSEMNRVLKPGGTLLVTVPAMPWMWGPHDIALGHRRRYTRHSLRRAIVEAGLEPVRIFSFMSLLSPILVPMRLISKIGFALIAMARGGMGGTSSKKTDTISYDMPGPLNSALLALVDTERNWVLKGCDFRAGSTLVAQARK